MNQSDAPCRNVGPDALTSQCSYEAFKAADQRLAAKVEEIDLALDKQGRADLQVAQSAWLTYRDATCSAEYHLYGGGSGGPMARSACLEAQTRERLADLHAAFAAPDIKGVFCANGGYGTSEIVDAVDYDLIARNPKVFLGFSDITLLHLAIRRRTGLVTFHGHMPGQRKFPPYSLSALRRAVCAPAPLSLLQNPPEADPVRPVNPLRTITPGQASGRLAGGNLSMVMAAMGTPWEIDTKGALLVLEDVDEAPYSVARMLLTLRLAGKLSQAAGIVIGACVNCERHSDASPHVLNEQLDHVLKDLGVPVFEGLLLGHTDEQLTIPLGAMARMDATARTLTVTESGVRA